MGILDRVKSTENIKSIKRVKTKSGKKRKERNRNPRTYKSYLKSKIWQQVKNRYFQRNPRKCVVCGSSSFVELHHIYYGLWGLETDEQLIPLCGEHHRQLHNEYGYSVNLTNETKEFIDNNKL